MSKRTRRRKPARGAARSRRHVITRKPPPPIRMKEIVRYRKGKRWVKAGTAGAEKYTYLAQVNRAGKIIRMLQQTTPHLIMKFVAPGVLDEDEEVHGLIAKSGRSQGMLRWAFQRINVYTALNRPAKLIEVFIKGRDTREKVRRLKILIEPESQRDLAQFLLSRIITAMREANLRTNYTLEMLKAAKHAGPLSRSLSNKKFASLEPLHDMEVLVTIHR